MTEIKKMWLLSTLVCCVLIYETSAQSNPRYTLPPLPYASDALEPYIDKKTMEVHHGSHHKAYTDNLNKALDLLASDERMKHYANRNIEDLLQDLHSLEKELPSIAKAIRNHGGVLLSQTMLSSCSFQKQFTFYIDDRWLRESCSVLEDNETTNGHNHPAPNW